jgi:hypothetical protein
MLSHLLGQNTHANTGKVVDGESDIAGVIRGEDAFEVRSQSFVGQACPQLGQSGFLQDMLKQDLDEDTATGRSLIFVEVNDAKAVPA